MIDLISRQAAIERFYRIIEASNTNGDYNEGYVDGMEFCIELIHDLPAVQPEIIRCRDCEDGEQDECGRWYCGDFGFQMGDEDGSGFCVYAKRRKDG